MWDGGEVCGGCGMVVRVWRMWKGMGDTWKCVCVCVCVCVEV